ncbi:hypothetical protein ACFWI0_30170 [[Kitasatospora] papulosa]
MANFGVSGVSRPGTTPLTSSSSSGEPRVGPPMTMRVVPVTGGALSALAV